MPTSTETFQSSWKTRRDRVEMALAEYVSEPSGLNHECPPRLREAMTYSLMAGGKRLRPVLVLMACEACGGSLDAAMPAACAIEMIHTYSLIHDDLPAMDNDDFRRGRPTNHKVFGDAMAILAGDALLTLAFEIVARDVRPASIAAACCADLAYAAGACGMVGGQVADLEGENVATADLQHLESIHRRKTGRLIRSALTMGGRIAEADAATLGTLDHFGTCIGLAFQVADDVLDVTSSQEQLGKGVGKDAGLGKLTYPGLVGVERSRQMAQQLINEACGTISDWGDRGANLQAMARFVLERDH